MKKKIFTAAMAVAGACVFAGCTGAGTVGTTETTETHVSEDEYKMKIVTTTFPQYDWVKNVLGERANEVEITLLCDNRTDMHSYQPTFEDVMKISEADVFLYVGGESDEWVTNIIRDANREEKFAFSLIEMLGDRVKEEERPEGMQENGEEEEEKQVDEHVWLSLKNAEILAEEIAEILIVLDEDTSPDFYQDNTEKYIKELEMLDSEYTDAVNSASVKTLLFADRFPFRYMTDDYGIEYYAAFDGCEADTEASFETIAFLSKKVDELSLKNIIKIDGSDGKIAETIKSNTQSKDQNIIELDSMQSVKDSDIEAGTSYISIKKKNLKVLKEALK